MFHQKQLRKKKLIYVIKTENQDYFSSAFSLLSVKAEADVSPLFISEKMYAGEQFTNVCTLSWGSQLRQDLYPGSSEGQLPVTLRLPGNGGQAGLQPEGRRGEIFPVEGIAI